MFRKELQSRLSEIFGLPKVTFDIPSEVFEQDTIFIEVADCRTRTAGTKSTAKVTGEIAVFAERSKMPYGFFAKRIEKASAESKKDLMFFAVDREQANSHARFQNISERRASFVFLFSSQYNPAKGTLSSVDFDKFSIDIGDGTIIDIGDKDNLRK